MYDGQQGRGSSWRRRTGGRRRLQRLKLATTRAVDHLPAACAQPLTNRIRGGEVALTPALDALGEQALRLFSLRSSGRGWPDGLQIGAGDREVAGLGAETKDGVAL